MIAKELVEIWHHIIDGIGDHLWYIADFTLN